MTTVKVRIPKIVDHQLDYIEKTVSKTLADRQLRLPNEKRNPAWRGATLVEEPKKKEKKQVENQEEHKLD